MVHYYQNEKWRKGVILDKDAYYQSVETGLRSAKKEWGSEYKNIKVKKNKNKPGYIVYGQKR